MKRLVVLLPRDRAKAGVLTLFDDAGELMFPGAPCLGKADNARAAKEGNPLRSPRMPYGDTPAGEYAPARVEIFAAPHARLGRGWIPLHGETGAALAAVRNGRTGLGIHAGRGDGALVPTFGCLRVSDSTFDRLVQAIGDDQVRVTIEDMP